MQPGEPGLSNHEPDQTDFMDDYKLVLISTLNDLRNNLSIESFLTFFYTNGFLSNLDTSDTCTVWA